MPGHAVGSVQELMRCLEALMDVPPPERGHLSGEHGVKYPEVVKSTPVRSFPDPQSWSSPTCDLITPR